MGTIIAVKNEGQYKIAQYGQWGGYPEEQGVGVLEFISDPAKFEKLKASLPKIRFIDCEGRDKAFCDDYDSKTPRWSSESDNRTPEQKRWHALFASRDLGSRILGNVANAEDQEILLFNHIEFANDSLFCEWTYVVDFDTNTFEVFKGFNTDPVDPNSRFFAESPKKEYYPVKLAHLWPLDALPTVEDFLATFEQDDEAQAPTPYTPDQPPGGRSSRTEGNGQ